MPCEVCNSILIRLNTKVLCPVCNNIPLLNRDNTIPILEKNLHEVENALIDLMKKNIDKNRLLVKLIWERERFARDFFEAYKEFDTTRFLTLNLLIFKLMRITFDGNRIPSNEEVEEIIDAFSEYIQMKNHFLLYKNELAEALKVDDKIRIIQNERYFPILSSYEDNLIMSKMRIGETVEKYKKVFDFLTKSQPARPVSYTPIEFVEHFYSMILQFYCTLLRNETFDEVFGLLSSYKELSITPGKLMDFVNSYQLYPEVETVTSLEEFVCNAEKHFNMKKEDVEQILVFNEKNTCIFPIFISINDTVHISHRTSFLIYIFLHSIVYKDMFDAETEKRSKAFENEEVKKKFETINWTYFPNLKDKKQPSIEIDGIATFKRKILVVECKGWTIRPFYEYAKIQGYLIRDIKGIVDGEKFTGEELKKIPSLLEKVSFVRDNMSIWGLSPSDYDEINGIIVMRGSPPIKEYKGIQILSINNIMFQS
ncbi:MAG: hypothetical protein A2W22_02350 [Candidatus Levybacteria bacterium RBG_16_35_11]|nr:MAG: hypothetical protein A2W22_02350 [Candidatus Levybacteria bacterium RBG_16_35_11]